MNCESKIKIYDLSPRFLLFSSCKFDSDLEYRLLSLIHIQVSYNLNLIMEKHFIDAWGLAIMQRPKLKSHNFDRELNTQNTLTERHVADEINLNQNVLKKLVFIQNRLGRHLS